MKRFSLKRLFVLLGVVSATAAVVASSAFAGPGATTCTSELPSGTVVGNLVVPAGATCTLSYAKVTGNVSVEGKLYTWHHVTFERNVSVNGGVFTQVNYPVVIKGNLSITGSAGENGYNGFFAPYAYGDITQSQVYGNFSYTGNSAGLYVGYSGLKVHGNFNHSGNTGASYLEDGKLTVGGKSNIS